MRVPCLLLASSVILMAGCSIAPIASKTSSPTPTPDPTPASVVTIKGVLHGGENPIVGARVYMYAVTLGGYGLGSTSLMQGGGDAQQDTNGTWYVPTDSNGNFAISADDYYCTAAGETAVYLYSSGGTPKGLAANPNAGLMAVLGPCTAPSVGTLTGGGFPSVTGFVIMNEVTTVAAAYSLAGFATDPTHISGGSTSQGATAVANAANNAFNLASLTTFVGQTPALSTTPGNPSSVVPQAEIDTLADALAACVSEAGGACNTLLQDTTNVSTNFDTAVAAIYIAQHPGSNVSGIFCLVGTGSAPFQPILSGPGFTTCPGAGPNDWTIAITYTNNGLSEPGFLAVDAPGNIWVSNNGNNTISEWNPAGNGMFTSPMGSGGLGKPEGIAIDTTSSFVWVVDNGGLSKFNISATPAVNGTPAQSEITSSALDATSFFLALDGNNNLWTESNANSTVTEFDSSGGNPLTSTITNTGGLNGPLGIAVDSSGNAWLANNGADSVSVFTVTGGDLTPGTPSTDGSMTGPLGIAIDHSGNLWITNNGSTSISELLVSSGSVTSGTAYSNVGGLNAPLGIAIDGLGNVWATDDPASGAAISELNSSGAALSPDAGYTGVPVAPATSVLTNPVGIAVDASGNVWVIDATSVLTNPVGIAVDASGNVWVIDATFGGDSPDNLVEFVGAAAPVVTPLALGVENGTLGTRP